MGCTWCKSRNRVVPTATLEATPPCVSQDSIPNAWGSDHENSEEQNTSGTASTARSTVSHNRNSEETQNTPQASGTANTVSHNTDTSYRDNNDGGQQPKPQPTTADACVETDFVYVHYENYKDKYETMSERLQEAENQRVQMNETHAVEVDLAVKRAEESTRMECQQEIDNYKKQVRENQKNIAESEAEKKRHLEIIESLKTELKKKSEVENQPRTQSRPSTSREIKEVINDRQIVVDSPTPNDIVVGDTVPVPTVADNDVRIEIKGLLNTWDNSGFLSEIEEHTSTVTGDTVQQLTSALTDYEQNTHNYLQVLQGKESYKIMLAKSYAIFAWIAKHIKYDFNVKESLLAGTLTAEQCSLDYILKKRSTICQGYSELFHAFSQAAGLETKIISGHSKSAPDRSAKEILNSGHYQSFTPKQSNSHCWNAVRQAVSPQGSSCTLSRYKNT